MYELIMSSTFCQYDQSLYIYNPFIFFAINLICQWSHVLKAICAGTGWHQVTVHN